VEAELIIAEKIGIALGAEYRLDYAVQPFSPFATSGIQAGVSLAYHFGN
jgi:hypothetical protein